MSRLKEKYNQQVVPAMQEIFGYPNTLAVPKLNKVVLNVGISVNRGDAKFQELVAKTLSRITGQRPVSTQAKKSISGFKTRQGQIIGSMVTLRQGRMYDFVDKLISLSLPNVRDFRGLRKKSIDQRK